MEENIKTDPPFEPIVTFLMCSRRKDNPDSKLENFLNTLEANLDDGNMKKLEVLIKFDDDDLESQYKIFDRNYRAKRHPYESKYDQGNLLKQFPFKIREFVYKQGMGRRSLHNDYMFLFSQRNVSSKFVAFATDDSIVLGKGMIEELERMKNKDWVFMGDKRPHIESYADYRNDQRWRMDVSMFPIVSTKIIECCGSMGWQVNIDNWFTLLAVIIYHKYGLDLWEGSYDQYIGRAGGESKESQYGNRYNPMEVNNKFRVQNTYYFDLVEQQAKKYSFKLS